MRKVLAYRSLINMERKECLIPSAGKTLAVKGKSLGEMISDARNQISEIISDESKTLPDTETEGVKSVPDGYIETYIDVETYVGKKREVHADKSVSVTERIRAANGFSCMDNCIEWTKNDQTVSFTFTQGKMIKKIESLALKYPDTVKILVRNEDGSVYGKMPRKALHLYLTETKEMTEEQKQAARDRLSAMRNKKGITKEKK